MVDEEIEEYYGVLQQHRTTGHYGFIRAHFPTDESAWWDER
jgi:glutamate synthase domain-containing protein 1